MFDPTLPQEGTPLDAAQMRSQLVSLFNLISNIVSVSAAQVDGVTTLPPGSAANGSVNLSGGVLHFSFSLPQGADGAAGGLGPPGPPFASALVDAVNTLPAGSNAGVSVSFDGTNVHFVFNIPQGTPGDPGPSGPPFADAIVDAVNTLPAGSPANVVANFDGTTVRFVFDIPQGNDGAQGGQGPTGEVSQSQLDGAIGGTSPNTNAVSTLDAPFADNDLETLRAKVNELILNGRR